MELLDDALGVGGAVEEIGIAEGDVPGAGFDLAADVLHHDVALDDAEGPLVNGDDGAMAAEMFAAAAGFGVAGDARFAAGA